MKGEIKEIFSKAKWDPSFKNREIEIVIIDRLVKNGRRIIKFSEKIKVKDSLIIEENGNWIPFHRILEIRDKNTGEVFWRKKL